MTRDWGSWSGSRFLETTQFRHPQGVENEAATSAFPVASTVQTIHIQGIPYAPLDRWQSDLLADMFARCRGAEQSEAYAPREVKPEMNALAPLRVYFSNS
jgi:hypothetical protein